MESAEHELLRTAGLQVIERQPDGTEVSWPRVSASCDYVSALRFGEAFDITVSVAATGRSSITYRFLFECDGRRVAEGRVVAVRCVMHPGRKPEAVAIPADIIAKLTSDGWFDVLLSECCGEPFLVPTMPEWMFDDAA